MNGDPKETTIPKGEVSTRAAFQGVVPTGAPKGGGKYTPASELGGPQPDTGMPFKGMPDKIGTPPKFGLSPTDEHPVTSPEPGFNPALPVKDTSYHEYQSDKSKAGATPVTIPETKKDKTGTDKKKGKTGKTGTEPSGARIIPVNPYQRGKYGEALLTNRESGDTMLGAGVRDKDISGGATLDPAERQKTLPTGLQPVQDKRYPGQYQSALPQSELGKAQGTGEGNVGYYRFDHPEDEARAKATREENLKVLDQYLNPSASRSLRSQLYQADIDEKHARTGLYNQQTESVRVKEEFLRRHPESATLDYEIKQDYEMAYGDDKTGMRTAEDRQKAAERYDIHKRELDDMIAKDRGQTMPGNQKTPQDYLTPDQKKSLGDKPREGAKIGWTQAKKGETSVPFWYYKNEKGEVIPLQPKAQGKSTSSTATNEGDNVTIPPQTYSQSPTGAMPNNAPGAGNVKLGLTKPDAINAISGIAG